VTMFWHAATCNLLVPDGTSLVAASLLGRRAPSTKAKTSPFVGPPGTYWRYLTASRMELKWHEPVSRY